jgi:methylenetetrahydrofolate dehydrogenase (NADP+)/methenyltetrahydrofolate cyclohydrolase
MSAKLIDGKAVATSLREALAKRVAALGFAPGLAVVLVGDDPASAVYVRAKDRAATAAGIMPHTIRLPAATDQAELLAVVARLNADPAIDGILVQMPLPGHIDTRAIIEAIDPAKDVDGFHPLNVGRLADGGAPITPAEPNGAAFAPCTPLGVTYLLAEAGVATRGARAVIVGRSSIVGRPMAQLLLRLDASVTILHSRTVDLPGECRRAEILVAAVGRPEMIRGDWISPGTTVIDVGINRLPDGRLVGDVATEEAMAHARAITPVPGGVGPMTIACLLDNTVAAAIRRR